MLKQKKWDLQFSTIDGHIQSIFRSVLEVHSNITVGETSTILHGVIRDSSTFSVSEFSQPIIWELRL